MQSISISRYLILAIVARYGPLEISNIQYFYQNIPSEDQQFCALDLGSNSIRGIICYLINGNLLGREGRLIGVTKEGMIFYQRYLKILGLLQNPFTPKPPKKKYPKILQKNEKEKGSISEPIESNSLPIIQPLPLISENKQITSEFNSIDKKKVGKKSTTPIDNVPKTPTADLTKSRPSPQEKPNPISGIISQFSTYFMPIIKDYRWNISEKKMEEIMTVLYNYWNIKSDSIQHQPVYPPETTSKMIRWLGLNSALFKTDEKPDIIAGLEFCWKYYQKEKGMIKN